MYTYDKDEFGTLLERLLRFSGQKNSVLANKLGYDVSYISKWINNIKLPTSKNIKNICKSAAEFFVSNADDMSIKNICEYLEVTFEDGGCLEKIIEECLYKSYMNSIEKVKRENTIKDNEKKLNADIKVNPRLQSVLINNKFKNVNLKNLNIILFVDLFSLGKQDKLYLAGINGAGANENLNNIENMYFNIYIDENNINLKFDAMLLLYMISNYSKVNFKMYRAKKPLNSMLVTIKDFFIYSITLNDNGRAILSSTCEEKKSINEMYETLQEITTTSSKEIFTEIVLEDIINKNYYMQSMLSENKKWLIGKVTEHILDLEVFNKLLHKEFKEDEKLKNKLYENYMASINAMMNSKMDILIYASTLNDFVLNGEINFFNKKVVLDIEDRERCFKKMHDFFTSHKNINFRIVDREFVQEFKNFNETSLFLSEDMNCIRLNNDIKNKEFLILKEEVLIKIFKDFFNEIWCSCNELVMCDSRIILDKISYYMKCLKMLKELKK